MKISITKFCSYIQSFSNWGKDTLTAKKLATSSKLHNLTNVQIAYEDIPYEKDGSLEITNCYKESI